MIRNSKEIKKCIDNEKILDLMVKGLMLIISRLLTRSLNMKLN